MSDVKSKLREFIVENYLFSDDISFEDNVSFLEEGIIDSTGILELIDFLEEEFDISVEDEEMIPENLDSLDNIAIYLGKKA